MTTDLQKTNVDAAARERPEFWSQRVIGEANGSLFKVAKGIRSTTWHAHEDSDEVFLVTSGELTIQLRDGDGTLGPGQLFVVPRGTEHCPITAGEVHAVLIEPAGVVNTGDAGGALTAPYDDSLA